MNLDNKKDSIDLMKLLGHMMEQFFKHFRWKAEFIVVMKKEGDTIDRFGMVSNFKNKLEVPLTLASLLERMMDKDTDMQPFSTINDEDETTH